MQERFTSMAADTREAYCRRAAGLPIVVNSARYPSYKAAAPVDFGIVADQQTGHGEAAEESPFLPSPLPSCKLFPFTHKEKKRHGPAFFTHY